jgi:UDP-N-acetylmuramate--alanine ligase
MFGARGEQPNVDDEHHCRCRRRTYAGRGVAGETKLREVQHVHLVGIGGSGMAALCSLLLQMGKSVTGSDVSNSSTLTSLRTAGAVVYVGHGAANLTDKTEYVVRSSAVRSDNPEVAEAERRGLPSRKLADAVGELMRGQSGVAVAGTHGKTTTTALVTWLLDQGGVDPLALIGADTPRYAHGARLGEGPMVVEADEYDRRFLSYWPEAAVVTSIEADHLDYYRDLAEIRTAFAELVQRLPPHGRLVVCADEPCAAGLESPARRESYGFAADADWRIEDYASMAGRGARFTLRADGRTWPVESPLVGEHNARNVAAAIVVADYFGVGLRLATAVLPGFEGPRRRFETRGRPRRVWIVDDYGHHPAEVEAVLHAARAAAEGEVWVVFQPHTTHRTWALFDQFVDAFDAAQHVVILPIYRPSGRDAEGLTVTAEGLVEAIQRHGHPDARYVEGFDPACEAIAGGVRPGDVVLTMGAGDVTRLSDQLVQALGA